MALSLLVLPLLMALSSSSGQGSIGSRPVRRLRWSSGTSIVDLMTAAEPVILTDSPAQRWASEHWSAAELRERLEILYNVRWSGTQRSFTYFTGKEWSALFGSPMERAAARMAPHFCARRGREAARGAVRGEGGGSRPAERVGTFVP